MQTERKKVLCPVQGKNGKTYWLNLGRAFTNRDGSTNVYLDAFPVNNKLHIRDVDERDKNPREPEGTPTERLRPPFPGFLADEGAES